MSYSCIEITRRQARAFRDVYLVRGVDIRAIEIIIPSMSDGTHYSNTLTEFEMYWLLVKCAKYAKIRRWKYISILINDWNNSITIKNCAGHKVYLGRLGDVIHKDHCLNDEYYFPKNFWIK